MDFQFSENTLRELISDFEYMSQKGTVRFYEETAFLDIIKYYEERNEIEKAISVCDTALTQHISSFNFLIHKGRLLIELKEPVDALACIERAVALVPNDFELSVLEVEALIMLGEFERAYYTLKDLYSSFRSDEERAHILYLRAKIHEIDGDFEKMFRALQKALRKTPSNPILLNKIWFATEMSGFYIESESLHLELIDEDPYSYLAWYNLGHAYFCQEEFELAADAFEYVFIINKKFDLAYKDGAEAYIMAENYIQALNCYQEFLEISEGDSDVYTKIGFCHEQLGEIEIAQGFYHQSIAINASNSMTHFRMGECFMFQEKWELAINAYNQAIEVDGREEYLAALAEAYSKTKNLNQAKRFFQKATEVAPELSKYWTQYATFLMENGKSEEAFSILDEAEIYAVGADLMYCKVACLFAMSKRKEALNVLSEALQENAALLESLYKISPDLLEDKEVRALVAAFER